MLAALGATPVLAQSEFPTPAPDAVVRGDALLIPNGTTSGGEPVYAPPSATNPLPVTTSPTSGAGSVTAATVGTSSAEVVAAAARKLLAIDNESNTATIACALGGTAALNSAGSFTIPPGMTRTWSGDYVPSDAINCIADAASTPVTVEAE